MQKLFYLLFLFFSALVAIAKNTGDYDAAAAAAKKGGTTLAPGKQYAFTGKGKNHHRRLIVGVVSGTKDNYDFKADMFELRIDGTASANPLKNHGKACGMSTNRDGDNWTCDRPQGLKFKGEVGAELTKVDIKAAGEAIFVGNQCYHVVNNNCRTFVSQLFKQIKAREITEEIKILQRDFDSAIEARDLKIRSPFMAAMGSMEIEAY